MRLCLCPQQNLIFLILLILSVLSSRKWSLSRTRNLPAFPVSGQEKEVPAQCKVQLEKKKLTKSCFTVAIETLLETVLNLFYSGSNFKILSSSFREPHEKKIWTQLLEYRKEVILSENVICSNFSLHKFMSSACVLRIYYKRFKFEILKKKFEKRKLPFWTRYHEYFHEVKF